MDLNDLCYLYSATTTDTATGSATTTFAIREAVYGRVQPASGREITRAGLSVGDVAYTIYFNNGTTISIKDRLQYDSTTFEIIDLVTYPNTYVRVLARKIM